MLGRGLFVSLFLTNVLINITGKTLLIETEDEQDAKIDDEKDTQVALAQGNKRDAI